MIFSSHKNSGQLSVRFHDVFFYKICYEVIIDSITNHIYNYTKNHDINDVI